MKTKTSGMGLMLHFAIACLWCSTAKAEGLLEPNPNPDGNIIEITRSQRCEIKGFLVPSSFDNYGRIENNGTIDVMHYSFSHWLFSGVLKNFNGAYILNSGTINNWNIRTRI
jgi:hypothetical protein